MFDSGPPPAIDRLDDPAPLLLLHGWTSSAALNWYRCFPALSDRYRVIALDHRGHGRGIRSRKIFRLEDCADDAAALIRQLGCGPCTVVGYSMGGPVAQLLWLRHPEVVRELVLCATSCTFAVGQRPKALTTSWLAATVALSATPPLLRDLAMGCAATRWRRSHSASEWATSEWQRHDPAAVLQAGVALTSYDASSWIGQVDVPTAVVLTQRDTTVPPARQQKLADLIRGSAVVPVDSDHRACVDAPQLFVPALIEACEKVREPSRVRLKLASDNAESALEGVSTRPG